MCWRFDGDWDRVPEFKTLPEEKVEIGRVPAIELSTSAADDLKKPVDQQPVNRRGEHVALQFKSQILVEHPDVFVFELTSDDGSRLWIDDELVVDNDGLHSSLAKRGRIALGEGWHRLEVGWFNKTGGAELSVKSGALGEPLGPVPLRTRSGAPR
jgi:hypothetical protein